jgi:hypothetical protein
MALHIEKPADRPGMTCTYWLLDEVRWDKSTGKATLCLAGYVNEADRQAAFPVAMARACVTVSTSALDIVSAYAAVKEHEDWAGAADC